MDHTRFAERVTFTETDRSGRAELSHPTRLCGLYIAAKAGNFILFFILPRLFVCLSVSFYLSLSKRYMLIQVEDTRGGRILTTSLIKSYKFSRSASDYLT